MGVKKSLTLVLDSGKAPGWLEKRDNSIVGCASCARTSHRQIITVSFLGQVWKKENTLFHVYPRCPGEIDEVQAAQKCGKAVLWECGPVGQQMYSIRLEWLREPVHLALFEI